MKTTKLLKPSLFYLSGRAKPWGLRVRIGGKYVPSYFATERERDQKAAELTKEIVAEEKPLTPEQRSWIRVVQSAARASGISEPNISAWLFAALSDRGKADASRASVGLTPTSPTIASCVATWNDEAAKRNLRPKTVEGFKRFLRFFQDEVDVEFVGELQRKDILNWITTRYTSEASRATLRSYLVPFLNWCAEQGWISRNEFLRLTWRKVRADEKIIAWATPEIVTSLMAAAKEDIRPALALGAFAGIRPEECQRVRWENINFTTRQITLHGTTTKMRKPRLLYELPEVLWLWLDRVPKEKRIGLVFAKSQRVWRRDFADAVKKAGLLPWPKDALRKGFATHGAVLKGQDWAKNIMGHVDHKLLDAVYRGAIDAATAKRYFELIPDSVLSPRGTLRTPQAPSFSTQPAESTRS